MPTYDVKNLKTGEKQTLYMTMKDYCQWKEENPDWDKDWEASYLRQELSTANPNSLMDSKK